MFLLLVSHGGLVGEPVLIAEVLQRIALEHPLFGLDFNSVVLLGMLNELEHSVESKVAAWLLALVRLGLRVSSQVFLQVAARGEAPGAKAAFKGATSGVRSLVHHQIRLVAESFATNFKCVSATDTSLRIGLI